MKKIAMAVALCFPFFAHAGFVEDCKTSYVQGDLFSKAGLIHDRRLAEKPFESRCVCISQSVRNSYDNELFLKYIEFDGRVHGVPASDRSRAFRIISDCNEKAIAEKRAEFSSRKVNQNLLEDCYSESCQARKATMNRAMDEMLNP